MSATLQCRRVSAKLLTCSIFVAIAPAVLSGQEQPLNLAERCGGRRAERPALIAAVRHALWEAEAWLASGKRPSQ